MMKTAIGVVVFGVLAGCTHYGMVETYGPRQEVARRLVGSPMIETVSSSSTSGGLESMSMRGRGVRYRAAGFEGGSDSVTRTHCVQQAQVDYVQLVDSHPVVTGRMYDVAAAVALGTLGLGVLGVVSMMHSMDMSGWESDREFHMINPDFFADPGPAPGPPNVGYGVAGGLGIASVGIVLYSFGALPKGPAPAHTRNERHFTETEYVEATGCGLVPADQQ